MNSKSFAYRVFVFLVVMGAMWSTGACSDNSTPVSDTQQNNAAFIQAQVTPTSGPRTVTTNARPSPTPTEIPLILPTPTEVGAGTPLPTNLLRLARRAGLKPAPTSRTSSRELAGHRENLARR